MRQRVTVLSADGRTDTYECEQFTTEVVQWRLDSPGKVMFIPIKGVRSVTLEVLGTSRETGREELRAGYPETG